MVVCLRAPVPELMPREESREFAVDDVPLPLANAGAMISSLLGLVSSEVTRVD